MCLLTVNISRACDRRFVTVRAMQIQVVICVVDVVVQWVVVVRVYCDL